ncbi:hypothetical protein [Celeribacter halophilus]|uniref:hypothetical protein n=1 Tax=Celeribacter halophilus TaxID=576117 RepID=UPI003A91381B
MITSRLGVTDAHEQGDLPLRRLIAFCLMAIEQMAMTIAITGGLRDPLGCRTVAVAPGLSALLFGQRSFSIIAWRWRGGFTPA